MDEMTLTLNNPLTEEEWDLIEDVDFDKTNSIEFHTKHGKTVKFVKCTDERTGDLISKLSEIRSEYNCFDDDEAPFYRALSEAIRILSKRADGDTISRAEAIDALWKALYEYEDETEQKYQASDELNIDDWFMHRIFVQNMSDIDRQTILALPSAQPIQRGWICPVCGRGLSPLTMVCPCQNGKGWKITCKT